MANTASIDANFWKQLKIFSVFSDLYQILRHTNSGGSKTIHGLLLSAVAVGSVKSLKEDRVRRDQSRRHSTTVVEH